jgi:diaminopimelate decarboxylase
MTEIDSTLRNVLPLTAAVDRAGHLMVGGCDTVELAREFGTPLYVFDEQDLRARCREFRREFEVRHPDVLIVYAAKAYLGRALASLVAEEGLGLDIVSGGELACARAVDFPPERVYFHGNNKSAQEIREALTAGVGRVVVDNFHELVLLADAAASLGRRPAYRTGRQAVLLRVTPGVDPHTHAYVSTGAVDSKFGLPLVGGRAEEALVQALASPGLEVVGLHYHLGSQITETEPYRQAAEAVLPFAARMKERHGLELREYGVGGGIAVPYTRDAATPAVAEYAETMVGALQEGCRRHRLPLPRLTVEPGRAIVARAAVAFYTVGATKEVPGVRTYVAVDGGMADNIRPALYGSRYEVLVANRMGDPPQEKVTVAGRYCESGDVLVSEAEVPRLWAGDLLALPVSGAYGLAMASNYNWALRPAVVMVKDGHARLIRRRETYDDLLACDILEGGPPATGQPVRQAGSARPSTRRRRS